MGQTAFALESDNVTHPDFAAIEAKDSLLSQRERQCLALMASGLTDEQIGAKLGVQRSTVRFHYRKICVKLGAINRCSAVYRAVVAGLI